MKIELLSKPLNFSQMINLFEIETEVKSQLFLDQEKITNLKITETNNTKIIRFNNLSKLNQMSFQVLRELYNALIFTNSNKLHILVGEETNKVFCVGADLKYFYEVKDKLDYFMNYGYLSYYLFYKVHKDYRQNSVAIFNGISMGGGLAIGIYSKYRIATESSVVAMPESKFGFFANCVYNNFIGGVVNYKDAIHMALFSHRFESYEVYLKKFATHFVLNEYLPNLLTDLCNISKLSETEKIIKFYHEKSIKNFPLKLKYEEKILNYDKLIESIYNFEIDKSFFLDFYEQLKYNLNKYDKKLLKELLQRSILALEVNLCIALSAYENLSYEENFELDCTAFETLIRSGNMLEGIRAYFIEKDNKPKWRAKLIAKF